MINDDVNYKISQSQLENIHADITTSNAAIKILTDKINELLIGCIDENGLPKAPSRKLIAKARSWLPPGYPLAYTEKSK